MRGFGIGYSAFDRFQQRHRSIGFPLAVLQKYADDQGSYDSATRRSDPASSDSD